MSTSTRGPRGWGIESVKDIAGGTVATEFPNIARVYFAERGISPDIAEVSCATELTPHVDIADAMIDLTSTGTTLQVNHLAIVDEVLESSVRLFANPDYMEDVKVQQFQTALESVITAKDKRYLMMNISPDAIEDIKDVIPGLDGPTVMDINGQDAVAIHVVVDEREVFEVINDLRAAGPLASL